MTKAQNLRFVIASELVLWFVIAFRSVSVGLDTANYASFYRAIIVDPSFAQTKGLEPLYVLMNLIAGKLGSFQFVLIIAAVVTCAGFGYFVYKNTEEDESAFWFIFFYLTLNLYFNSMHVLRQICAMAICINIYTVLKHDRSKRGVIKSLILLIVGAMFHFTAFLSLAFFLPFWRDITKKSIRNIICLSLAGMAMLSFGQNILLKVIPKLYVYIGDERLSTGGVGVYLIAMILLRVVMIAFTLTLDPAEEDNKELYRLAYLNVIATAFFILQMKTQFAMRMGYYFDVFTLLFIPEFIRHLKRPAERKAAFTLMYLFGVSYFVYMMTLGGVKSNRGTVPYTFFW